MGWGGWLVVRVVAGGDDTLLEWEEVREPFIHFLTGTRQKSNWILHFMMNVLPSFSYLFFLLGMAVVVAKGEQHELEDSHDDGDGIQGGAEGREVI